MSKQSLRYQSVMNSDGTVAMHEALLDSEGNINSVTYEPVRLEATTFGELSALLRTVYSHMQKYKPITEEELDALIYGSNEEEPILNAYDSDEDNVINLAPYFAK